MCQTTALFFVPLVPGFSTASYLKVHIKTHHGSPLPPSATMHTFPEPRGELQVHNGNPYHMGRQCSVEGKRPIAPSRAYMFLAFHLLCCFFFFFFWRNMLLHLCVCWKREHTSTAAALHTVFTAVTYLGCLSASCLSFLLFGGGGGSKEKLSVIIRWRGNSWK